MIRILVITVLVNLCLSDGSSADDTAPVPSSSPLPVILFVHPGGFYSGSGRRDFFGPHYLLDRDIVLVTINYRLSSFDPNPRSDTLKLGSLRWPVMTAEQRQYLRIDHDFSVKQKLNERTFQIWEDLYPTEYRETCKTF